MKKIFLLASILLLGGLNCLALNPGDPAPELQIAAWIKNGPIKINDSKNEKIHVVEFWTSKCKPCLEAMPHLQQLQAEFKNDLTVISISTEPVATIKAFLAGHDNINYAIAADDNYKTFKAYMQGHENIPMAFVINKSGTIAWVGHPTDMYLPLKRVITGKFNIAEEAARQEIFKKIQILLTQKKYPPALKIVEDELTKTPENIQFIALKAFILFNQNKKTEAVDFISKTMENHPCSLELFELKSYMLNQLQKYKELDAFTLEFVSSCKEQPLVLNQLSRKMLGTRFGEARLEPAMKAAELAYSNRKINELQRADIGETLARIYYMTGRIDRAIKIQKIICQILKKNKKTRYVFALKILGYYQQAYNLGQGLIQPQTEKQK